MRDGETLTESKIESYIALLQDLTPESLENGLRKAAQECTWFPTVAEIRQRCENRELAAEQGWMLVDRIFRKHWHPDLGYHTKPPEIDGATEYALRQIGGLHALFNAPLDKQPFLRRDFLAAHARFNGEGGQQMRLSQGLAEKTLKQISDMKKQLEEGKSDDAA